MGALKLYIEAAANPLTIAVGAVWFIGLIMVFALKPSPVGSDDYITMISIIGSAHIGLFFMVFFGGYKTSQNKFYLSSCCAKHLFTTIPIIVSFMICFAYDTVQALLAYVNLGNAGLSDVLVSNSVCGAIMILYAGAIGKKKLEWFFSAPYIGIIILSSAISHSGRFNNGFGLPLGVAFVIAFGAYALGITLTLLITNIWWKNGNRHSMPNKFVVSGT